MVDLLILHIFLVSRGKCLVTLYNEAEVLPKYLEKEVCYSFLDLYTTLQIHVSYCPLRIKFNFTIFEHNIIWLL